MPFLSEAEKLFWDNAAYNTSLAFYKAKPHIKGMGSKMSTTAKELLNKLEEWDLKINRRTLTNYVKWGLISAPVNRTGGKGVQAEFPDVAVAEAAAAAELMSKYRWSKDTVANARYYCAALNDKNFKDFDETNGEQLVEIIKKTLSDESKQEIVSIPALFSALNAKTWWTTVKFYYSKI